MTIACGDVDCHFGSRERQSVAQHSSFVLARQFAAGGVIGAEALAIERDRLHERINSFSDGESKLV
jgi:hypothetical protein